MHRQWLKHEAESGFKEETTLYAVTLAKELGYESR